MLTFLPIHPISSTRPKRHIFPVVRHIYSLPESPMSFSHPRACWFCQKLDVGISLDGSKFSTKFQVVEADIEMGIAGENSGFGLAEISCMGFERAFSSVSSAFSQRSSVTHCLQRETSAGGRSPRTAEGLSTASAM